MKFYFIIIVLSISFVSNAQKDLDLSVTIAPDIVKSRLILEYWNGNVSKTLSDTFLNNSLNIKFQFYAKYAPIMISYKLKNGNKINNTFFVEGKKSTIFIEEDKQNNDGAIKLTYSKNVFCVSDSNKNPLFRDLMRSRQKPSELMTKLYEKNGGKIEKFDSLKALRNQYFKDLNFQTMNYLKDHSTEYFSFWYFWYQVVTPSSSMGSDTFYLRSLVNYFHTTFPKKYQQSYEGNYMMQMLEGSIKPPDINCDSPKFSKTDIFDKKIAIDKLKGKYVLLDFWASWCMPCLASVPVLKTLSNKYSLDSFVIIGISIDGEKQKMKSSIKEKEMNWFHIWDYDNDLSNQFGVFSIPTFILIDKQGRIVFRGKGLEDKEKVAKYLDEKLNLVQ